MIAKKQYRDIIARGLLIEKSNISYAYTYLDNKSIDQLRNFVKLNYRDKSLFRYASFESWERDEKILSNDKFFLTFLKEQNDPFEFSYINDVDRVFKTENSEFIEKEYLKKLKDTHEKFNRMDDKQKDEYAIKCFCEESDNILLWAYYANSHRGYCLEYDMLEMFEMYKNNLVPILYQVEIPQNLEKQYEPNYDTFIRISTKSCEWEHEKEWRIIKMCGTVCSGSANIVNSPKPKGVYLGCNVNKSDENMMSKFCKEVGIPLYRMQTSKKEYKLRPQLIKEQINE